MENKSMQCSVCGQWKRLTLTNGMQSFYPCCGEQGQYIHEKNVCDECCKEKCPYRTQPSQPGEGKGDKEIIDMLDWFARDIDLAEDQDRPSPAKNIKRWLINYRKQIKQ